LAGGGAGGGGAFFAGGGGGGSALAASFGDGRAALPAVDDPTTGRVDVGRTPTSCPGEEDDAAEAEATRGGPEENEMAGFVWEKV